MKTLRKKIEVMRAYKEGRVIEMVYLDDDSWETRNSWAISEYPSWDWVNQDYKVSDAERYTQFCTYPTGEVFEPVFLKEPNRSYMYYMLDVMESFLDGKKVEQREKGTECWEKVRYPKWDWKAHEYRLVQ